MSMNAEAPCPKDSAIMRTWEMYKMSDEYKNSHKWATRFIPEDDPVEMHRIRMTGANPFTKEMKISAVEGSLWAAFLHGWLEAGGTGGCGTADMVGKASIAGVEVLKLDHRS
jgi:hypothetical protein